MPAIEVTYYSIVHLACGNNVQQYIYHILFMYTKAIATYTCQGWHLLVGDYGRHLTISLTDL